MFYHKISEIVFVFRKGGEERALVLNIESQVADNWKHFVKFLTMWHNEYV